MRRRGGDRGGGSGAALSRVGLASGLGVVAASVLLLVAGAVWEPSSAGASGGVGGVGSGSERGVAVDRRTGRSGAAGRAPVPIDPGAQREEMIALLRAIEARLASLDGTLRDAAGNND